MRYHLELTDEERAELLVILGDRLEQDDAGSDMLLLKCLSEKLRTLFPIPGS